MKTKGSTADARNMAAIVTCDSATVDKLRTQIQDIYKVIETFRWIIEAYVSDFYTKDHWSHLPLSWQQYLGQLDFSHLSHLLTGQPWCQATESCSVSPLSLLALKAFCQHRSLNRHYVDLDSPHIITAISQTLQGARTVGGMPQSRCPDEQSAPVGGKKCPVVPLNFRNGQLMEMEHVFRKHVKPKKQHEIRQLGKVIHLVTQVSGSSHVVDVGAGLGHLSRLLTFAHGLKVTTVEATGGHAPKASEFDRELKKDMIKKLKKSQPSAADEMTMTPPSDLPHHVVCTVRPDISTQDFLRLVLHRDLTSDPAEEANMPSVGPRDVDAAASSARNRDGRVCMHSDAETASGDGENLSAVGGCGEERTAKVARENHAAVGGCGEERTAKVARESLTAVGGCGEERTAKVARESLTAVGGCGEERTAKVAKYDCSDQRQQGFVSQQAAHSDISNCPDALCKSAVTHEKGKGTMQNCDMKRSDKDGSASENQKQNAINLSKTMDDARHNTPPHQQICDSVDDTSSSTSNCDMSDKDSSTSENQKQWAINWSKTRDDPRHNTPPHQQTCDSVDNTSSASNGDDRGEDCGQREEGAEVGGLVLAGLHACGDLTPTLLRVFVNCPAVSALVSVGCCYMKLSMYSSADSTQTERGYPLSQFVQGLEAHPLTYEAREMACHFADAYAQRLCDNPPHLKIHSYRAAVQYVVTQIRPDFVPGATRLVVKKGAEVPFPQYANQCLRRLGIDPTEVPDDLMTVAESLTTEWHRVVAFYTLRLSLAPLVETAVLLDRMLFLYERGVHSVLVPVFDSALSPRNFALSAARPSTPAVS